MIVVAKQDKASQKTNYQHGLSRRSFLKGGSLAAGAALFAGSGFALTGCGQESNRPAKASASTTNGESAPSGFEVINSDLIIIGAGLGASAAAFRAVSLGQRVTIIDKGPFLHSGNAGFNWDLIAGWLPDMAQMENDLYSKNLIDQEMNYHAMTDDAGSVDRHLEWLNRGQTILARNEDGSPHWYSDHPFMRSVQGIFPRLTLDEIAKSPLVTIVDKTMATDLLINDGRCWGVIGLYLPTGDYRAFRAPATILATGPTNWFYGWTGVTAYTNGSCDNTGDIDMALFRRGVGIGESEWAVYDFLTTYPKGLGFGFNTSLNPDANEYLLFADKDGNPLVTEENGWDIKRASGGDRNYFNSMLGKLIADGYGTEEGGLLCGAEYDHLRTTMKQNLPVFESFGVNPLEEKIPIHDEIYERGGAPIIDQQAMCDGVEGLFLVRGAGAQSGTNGGSMAIKSLRFGLFATNRAIDYTASSDTVTAVDWAPAEEEIARMEELLTRNVEGGLRPFEVRHRIQRACGECMGVYRQTEKLEAALEELKRVRDEDMPKMVVSNKTKTYNTEWKEAIENYNLLDAALLAVAATLTREETRGGYYRPDFPERDDENWKCMLVGTKVNGEIEFSKKELPVHVW